MLQRESLQGTRRFRKGSVTFSSLKGTVERNRTRLTRVRKSVPAEHRMKQLRLRKRPAWFSVQILRGNWSCKSLNLWVQRFVCESLKFSADATGCRADGTGIMQWNRIHLTEKWNNGNAFHLLLSTGSDISVRGRSTTWTFANEPPAFTLLAPTSVWKQTQRKRNLKVHQRHIRAPTPKPERTLWGVSRQMEQLSQVLVFGVSLSFFCQPLVSGMLTLLRSFWFRSDFLQTQKSLKSSSSLLSALWKHLSSSQGPPETVCCDRRHWGRSRTLSSLSLSSKSRCKPDGHLVSALTRGPWTHRERWSFRWNVDFWKIRILFYGSGASID